MKRNPKLRVFVKIDKSGNPIPSSVVMRRGNAPRSGNWLELAGNVCCTTTTTTTTTQG